MAGSKSTRKAASDTNDPFRTFFQNGQVSEEREREWRQAVRHAGTGTPPLRFPVYEHLYFLNVYAQKMVDLLKEVSVNREISLYHQSLIQYVRATVSRDLLESMSGIEHTESWLFQTQRDAEEKKLFDPEDVYFLVRQREAERTKQGLAPRIKFLKSWRSGRSGETSDPTKPH